jgi:ParB family chromosome partitioning protein
VRFVGLDAYEAAGGRVRRDLFTDGGYVQDGALLDALTRQKLEAVAGMVKEEGWKWTEARTSFGWEHRSKEFTQAEMILPEPSEAQQAEADQLREEYNALCDTDAADEEAEAVAADRRVAIEARLNELDAQLQAWPDKVKANAGAVVYLGHDGSVAIDRGLIRKDDAAHADADGEQDGDASGTEADSGPAPLPASLVEELTAHKTASLRIELARSPDTALALTVHAMATCAFYRSGARVLKAWITTRSLRPSIKEHDACPAVMALNDERDRIGDMLPGDQADLWDWCLKAERDTLLDVLAVATAHGVDAVCTKNDANAGGREQGQALAQALKLDMAQWYRPTAAGYFSRISKAAILSDLQQARQAPPAPSWAKMKKGELAVLAERETETTGWLPALLQ